MTRTESHPFFDRVVSWSFAHPQTPLTRYLATTLVIAAIALLRALLITSLVPWLVFIPAIVAIGLVFGERPAIYGSVLATVLAAVSIGSATAPLWLTSPQWGGSVIFFLVAVGLSLGAGELRAGMRRTRVLATQSQEREAFLSSVLASSTDCIKVMDLDGRLTFMNEGGMEVMEISDFNEVQGCPWPDFWQDAGNVDATAAIAEAMRGKASTFVGKADTHLGTPKQWGVSVSPILGPDGKPNRILAVSRDITALIEAQEQQQLLNGELGHRLKNVLALVQSIANQTLRQADNLQDANLAFSARLAALGKATDVLTATAWQSASLQDVVKAGLTSIDGMTDRVETDGPPMKLESQVAMALTLALHELATNACKYGALSNDTGTVSLKWNHGTVENDEPDRFSLTWQEAGGPTVSPPTRKGFGSKMIERSLSSYFRGKTTLDYDPNGVIFTIDAPLPKAGMTAG